MAGAVRLFSWLIALVVLLAPRAPAAMAAEPEWLERRTEHFLLRFTSADSEDVSWYGDFVEDAYRHVVEVFGHEPAERIALTFYSDAAAYAKVNPVAGREEGVLGHAQPSTGDIGLALWRLQKQSETLRRDAVRHELSHVILGSLTDHKLPIGFQEGLAQYIEQDLDQRAKLVRALRRGHESGQLLSLTDLNRQRAFLVRAGIAYPQSYSLVAFLSERYGFGHIVRMLTAVREETSLEDAMQRAFGRSTSELEAEWKAFLPGFLEGGWKRNDLDLWDMAEPRRLLSEGKFSEAREGFQRAVEMFEDVGLGQRLEEARTLLRRSNAGREAIEIEQRGLSALERHDYASARDLLSQADSLWGDAGQDQRRQVAATGLDQATLGLQAVERLTEAQELVGAWRLGEARAAALRAGETFVQLGDGARTAEANAVLENAQLVQNRLGMAAIGGGTAALGVVALAWALGRRGRVVKPAAYPVATSPAGKERDWSL